MIFNLLRKCQRIFRKWLKSLERARKIARWEDKPSIVQSSHSTTAHLLLVKKSEYVSMARTCVSSFLYFNPDYRVIIHCDAFVAPYAIREFEKSKFRDRIEISTDQTDATKWQELKLNLIVSLKETHDIFMDADLRWNGQLKQRRAITFLTCEYEMNQKSPARQIVKKLGIANENPKMYNVSLFSFGGVSLSKAQENELFSTYKGFDDLLHQSDIGLLDIQVFNRLSEQFTLSVHAPRWGAPIEALKSTDSPRDGGIVESTYFGVTGDTF